jgi:hypothetical protein
MQYRTIVLEIIQQNPTIHDQLRCKRELLATLRLFAIKLRIRHEAWMYMLKKAMPDSEQSQISGEAFEYALLDLKDSLRAKFPPEEEEEPFPVEDLMAFVLARTRRG